MSSAKMAAIVSRGRWVKLYKSFNVPSTYRLFINWLQNKIKLVYVILYLVFPYKLHVVVHEKMILHIKLDKL